MRLNLQCVSSLKDSSDWQNRTTAQRESDSFITSMITLTDRIDRHDVPLPINQNHDKIETNKPAIGRWTILKRRYEMYSLPTKCTATARAKWHALSNYKHDASTDNQSRSRILLQFWRQVISNFSYSMGSFVVLITAACTLFLLKKVICFGNCPALTLLEGCLISWQQLKGVLSES